MKNTASGLRYSQRPFLIMHLFTVNLYMLLFVLSTTLQLLYLKFHKIWTLKRLVHLSTPIHCAARIRLLVMRKSGTLFWKHYRFSLVSKNLCLESLFYTQWRMWVWKSLITFLLCLTFCDVWYQSVQNTYLCCKIWKLTRRGGNQFASCGPTICWVARRIYNLWFWWAFDKSPSRAFLF